MKTQTLWVALLLAIFFTSCKNQNANNEAETTPQPEKISVGHPEAKDSEGKEGPAEVKVIGQPEEDKEVKADDPKTVNEKEPKTSSAPKENGKTAPKDTPKEEKPVETPPNPDPETPGVTTPAKPDVPEPPATEPETPEVKPATDTPEPDKPEDEKPSPFSHDIWDGLTRKYVSSTGKVNYAGFKKEIAQLDAYIELLKNNPPSGSRASQMAYWINVYNANTVKMITDKYPVSSITKLHGGEPWKVKWVEAGGKTYSLDEVENSVIRPKFKDGRIHFAVNCAAKSCPPLLNRAWTESNLNSYLEQQTKKFINNPAFNQITGNSAKLSKIFEWYAVDFGDILTYINKYSDTKVKPGSKVEYNEYDWSLND